MTDAGFFKGTSADQDSRFADKKKKLLKSMEFGDNLNKKVDMTKVNVESLRPWIVKRITELLTYEDDILCDYVFNQLSEQHPDPKEIQINMTGFLLSKNARIFISELWDLLLSAMATPGGVPAVFLEAKKVELSQKQEEEAKMRSSFARTDSDQKRASNLDSQRTAARTDFSKAESPAAAIATADGTQDRQSPSRVRRRQKYSSSSADERSHSRSISRSPASRGRRSAASPLADHDDRSRRHHSRRHVYESSRRSSSGDSRGRRRHRRHHHRRERRSEDGEDERDYRRRSNRGRRESELTERSRRHRHYSEDDESPDDDRRLQRRREGSGRRERDRREKQGSDDHRPLSPRRPPEGPICVPQDSPLRAPVAVASPVRSASPVTDKPSPPEEEEQEEEIVALPPPLKRRRSGSVRQESDEGTKSRHRENSPSPHHRHDKSSRHPAEDSGLEDRAVYPSDRRRRVDKEREAVTMELSPPVFRHQHRSRSRDGIERSHRRVRDESETADHRKSTAADYASRYQRMENGGMSERSRRERMRDEYEHRFHENERLREAKRRTRRREADDFRHSSHSPEGPSLPPQLEGKHVSPEGPELPPTLQSVVKPVTSASTDRTRTVSHKNPTRRSVSSENNSTSASSDSSSDGSSDSSSSDSSSEDSSSGSSTINSSGAEERPRKPPSEGRRLPNRSHRTTEEVERKPRPPKTDSSTVSSAKVKQKSDEVVPEGPALPPANVNDLEWKEHNVPPSSESESSASSSNSSTSGSDSSSSSSSSESDDSISGRPSKRRHATAADDKRRRDSRKKCDDSYRRHDQEYSARHQVDRKSSSRRHGGHGEAGRSPRNSASTEDVLRQRALESLLKRKKSTEVH